MCMYAGILERDEGFIGRVRREMAGMFAEIAPIFAPQPAEKPKGG